MVASCVMAFIFLLELSILSGLCHLYPCLWKLLMSLYVMLGIFHSYHNVNVWLLIHYWFLSFPGLPKWLHWVCPILVPWFCLIWPFSLSSKWYTHLWYARELWNSCQSNLTLILVTLKMDRFKLNVPCSILFSISRCK